MSTSHRSVIDTYAWVEYLLGSKAGAKAREYIEGTGAVTPTVVLLELTKWYLREIEANRRTESEMHEHLGFVETSTEVVPLDASLALKAGELDFLVKKSQGMAIGGLGDLRDREVLVSPGCHR